MAAAAITVFIIIAESSTCAYVFTNTRHSKLLIYEVDPRCDFNDYTVQ